MGGLGKAWEDTEQDRRLSTERCALRPPQEGAWSSEQGVAGPWGSSWVGRGATQQRAAAPGEVRGRQSGPMGVGVGIQCLGLETPGPGESDHLGWGSHQP